MVERVPVVVPGPFGLHPHRLEGGDARGDHRPDVVLPEVRVDLEIVGLHRRVVRRVTARLIGPAPVLADVNAGGVDGQRQVPVERPLRPEHPAHALPRLHRELHARHRRDARGARPGRVHHLTAGDAAAVRQHHRLHPGRPADHPGDLRPHDLHPPLAPRAAPGVEHRRPVPVALVLAVDRAQHDPVQRVERVGRRDLLRRHQHRLGPRSPLHGRVRAQHVREPLVRGEVHVTEVADGELRHPLVPAHALAQGGHELRRELRDADVQLGRELLAHARVGVRRGGRGVGRVPLDHEHPHVRRHLRQPPRGRGPHDPAADDHHVVGSPRRPVGDRGQRHQPSPRAAASAASRSIP